MVLKKVFGLRGTGITLNERFTFLAAVPHQSINEFVQPNIRNRGYLEEIDRLEQSKRQVLYERLGMNDPGGLRRIGSESSLPGLNRSNSYSSLNQERNIKQRLGWRHTKRNMSRSASLNNLAGLFSGVSPQRAYRRRGGLQRSLRGKFGDGQDFHGLQNVAQQLFMERARSRVRGGARGVGRGGARGGARGGVRGGARGSAKGAAWGGLRQAGRSRARGRGGTFRNTVPLFTKEELDAQLEQYMAGSKAALDRELETYMKNAMDLE